MGFGWMFDWFSWVQLSPREVLAWSGRNWFGWSLVGFGSLVEEDDE